MAMQLVRTLTRTGRPAETKTELSRLAFRIGIDDALARQANRIVSSETAKLAENFVESRFIPASSIKSLSAKMPAMREKFDKGVFEVVRRGLVRGESEQTIQDRIKRLGRTQGQHIATISNTIQIGIARQGAMEQATSNGAKYYRYTGAKTNARKFCDKHIGKVYSIDEIKKMDNGQGLPVEYFCGGYNCRHRWVAIEGRFEDGVFVNAGFDVELNHANKKNTAILKKELKGAKQLSAFGSVEISNHSKSENIPDADIRFDGAFAQLKQPTATKPAVLKRQLERAEKQNNNTIVIVNNFDDEVNSIRKAKEWLLSRTHKRLRVLNLYTNQFYEVKNERK